MIFQLFPGYVKSHLSYFISEFNKILFQFVLIFFSDFLDLHPVRNLIIIFHDDLFFSPLFSNEFLTGFITLHYFRSSILVFTLNLSEASLRACRATLAATPSISKSILPGLTTATK